MIVTSLTDREVLRLARTVLDGFGRTDDKANKQILNELAERFDRMLSSSSPSSRTNGMEPAPNQLKLL